ncbi:hypothetical protein GH714_038850 [Hevea brasiliensis]|uniref:O-methyltransferase domain-containing protein n=1 Tax=Hevea brasiliensis TaxID=3981 RepID=A0A6A6KLM2_HEVBR|nr:hypothetical protein GH714_038850 [Hevea brasiliensis]
METESSETRNQARLAILELANMISVPMSLHAVVRLNVADAIWQGGTNLPLSASEILAAVHPSGGDPAIRNLQRILRMLTSYGVFAEHLSADATERRYSLTEIGKTLVTDGEGLSYASYVLQHHQDALMRAWPLVHEAVLDPTTEPFVKANDEPAYSYYGKQPEMNDLMLKAMSGVAVPFMKAVLNGYDGFQGLERLVDVGVIHVGGDMFKSIPSADGIFMKWILTTWTDDECKLIMENCYKALPVGGKLIACEPVLPKDSDDSHRTRALLEGDIFVMTIYRAKGKHRTEEEFKQLGQSVGFSSFQAFYIDYFYTVLEFQK